MLVGDFHHRDRTTGKEVQTQKRVVLKVSFPYFYHLSEACCQHFNGVLPGKGPVSGGELVVSTRQRDEFQITSHHLDFRNAKVRTQHYRASLMGSSWAALSLLHLVQKRYLHPHRPAGEQESQPHGESSAEEAGSCPRRLEAEQAPVSVTFHQCS